MKEYIDREAALETAYNPFTMSMCVTAEEYENMIRASRIIYKQLCDIPAADVAEVVRCGECMHRDKVTGWCEDVQDYISNTNWFCAGGEKKGGADGE